MANGSGWPWISATWSLTHTPKILLPWEFLKAGIGTEIRFRPLPSISPRTETRFRPPSLPAKHLALLHQRPSHCPLWNRHNSQEKRQMTGFPTTVLISRFQGRKHHGLIIRGAIGTSSHVVIALQGFLRAILCSLMLYSFHLFLQTMLPFPAALSFDDQLFIQGEDEFRVLSLMGKPFCLELWKLVVS